MEKEKPPDLSNTPKSVPNVWNTGDPTDGRGNFDYQSKYPCSIRVQIHIEAVYLIFLLILGFYTTFWILNGDSTSFFSSSSFNSLNDNLKKLFTLGTAGLIGGSMFGIKYLYHVTGRGWWHEDRRIWRIYSPLLAASLACMFGFILDGKILDISQLQPTVTDHQYIKVIGVGFIIGYFADTALAKLQEVATVVFGTSARNSAEVKNKDS